MVLFYKYLKMLLIFNNFRRITIENPFLSAIPKYRLFTVSLSQKYSCRCFRLIFELMSWQVIYLVYTVKYPKPKPAA